MNSTLRPSGRRSASVAPMMSCMMIGAPHMWLTSLSASASKIGLAAGRRRHTEVPATSASVHGKHQPLQWNIGRVQR